MKTLLLTLEYPPFKGGIANYYGNLVKYWPEPDGILVLNNNQGELLSNRLPLGWLKVVFKLRQTVKAKNINHLLVGQILPLGTAALICSKFCQIKYSIFLHGLDFTCALKSYRKKFISQKILNGAEIIICANSYVADLLKQTFLKVAPKIIVVNPGAEGCKVQNTPKAAQLKEKFNLKDKIILLSVGRLIKRKGFDLVLDCLPQVLKQVPNLVYVIIGDGEERKNYELRVMNYELKNKVLIINNMPDEEKNLWHSLCDIFVMPARNIAGDFEGFGIVYLEANLAGKPVIAGRSGGVSDAVIDGLNGLLVDPENVNDLSKKIIRLALDHELRQKLGEQGRERALREFNWQKQTEKIYNIIGHLLATG
ncbi:MAG: Phosphatidylinositol alpha-1,6-mannosyltransferase [Parcubacteria group bacterium GW2011_GWC2_42_12]|nr:MAG: Phosphatidylinositol alpha-1,6-mannosyltransferase [Parcubacteria group bacterium GW2011_GWC2_42_12]